MIYNHNGMRAKPNHISRLVSLSGAFLPLFLLIATMKTQRGIALGSVDSVSSGFMYLLVEFSVFLLFTAMLSALVGNIRQRFWLGFALLSLYLLITCTVLVELATHELFQQTGLILNWPMFLFGLERSEMVFKALDQQVATSTSIYVLVALSYLVFVATIFLRKISYNTNGYDSGPTTKTVAVSLIGYIALLLFSTVSEFPREEFRGASTHLALSYFESREPKQQKGVTESNDPATSQTIPSNISINNRINIVIVILESTRQDSVAPYVDTEVTPYFAKLAENSLLAEHAYSTSPHTSRAIYSILCGRFPRSGSGIAETLENGIRQVCLPHLLVQQGYTSAFFQSATENFENRAQLVENMGFSEFFPLEIFDTTNFEKSNYFGYEDNIMLPASHNWLRSQKQAFLATYLTVTPHFHYDAISRYGWKNYAKDKKYNAYLNTLYYQDNFLKNLVQQYKDLGLYQNTLFVILGDHGEAFREHNLWGHGNILYEEGVKIPFILHYAGNLKGSVAPRVSLLDVVPSVLGQLQFDGSDDFFPGQDLFQPVEERDILLECISPNQCSSLIDAETNLKLIHNYHRKPDKLFDLSTDPQETNNLADDNQFQAIKQTLLTRLHSKINEVSIGDEPKTYSSWAYNARPVIWVKELPVEQAGFQKNLTIRHVSGDSGVLAVTASKEHIFAGDSFNLYYFLRGSDGEICIDSFLEGIKRHEHRTHSVVPNQNVDAVYFQITENLQILPDATTIKVGISTKSDCSSSAAVLSRNQLIINLPEKDHGKTSFSKKYNQLFIRRPDPADEKVLQTTIYLHELLDPNIPANRLNAISLPSLRSVEFVDKFRDNIAALAETYGTFLTSHLDSVWESKDGGSISIYRYRVNFSNNRAMDFRLIVRNSNIVALYYYHPWKKGRPL